MLWNLDFVWLLLAVAAVSIVAFGLSIGLDAIMGEEGFGPTGNMVVITAGFFLSIFTANSLGIRLADLTMASAAGIAGAFLCLLVLVMLKAALNRP